MESNRPFSISKFVRCLITIHLKSCVDLETLEIPINTNARDNAI